MFAKKFELPVNDNLKLTTTDKGNLKNMVMDPANSEWTHGFGLEFTL